MDSLLGLSGLFLLLLQGCDTLKLSCYASSCQYGNDCNTTVVDCKPDQGKVSHCYASWRNDSEGVKIIHRGCWIHQAACSRKECIASSINLGLIFCCCQGNLCNGNITGDATLKTRTLLPSPVTTASVVPTKLTKRHNPLGTLLYTVVPVVVFGIILVFGFFIYYRHKTTFPRRGIVEVDEELNVCVPPSPDLHGRLLPIQLVEVLSLGQYGTVWKANYLKETVAVKIISVIEKAAWATEKEFYTECNLNHENILKFLAAEKHVDCAVEYWLITEYHERGSLADYLKQNVVSWNELCKINAGVASGLAYLHSELFEDNNYKPCIAHRDVKSKNILVKKDLTCCISDFGLAAKFEAGNSPGETHGQVGTKRYMAPEVLEGAITFTRDAFLRIDVYALALVLWEVLSRCTAASGPVDEYRVPFEEEVGLHPSLEDMQQAVSQKKIRPHIRQDWRVHSGMAVVCQTVEECWDQDAEARLTAPCVAERLAHFQNNLYSLVPNQCSIITPLINNTDAPSLESSI